MGTKWVQRIEEGGCRQDQRAVLVPAFERGWLVGNGAGRPEFLGRVGEWSEVEATTSKSDFRFTYYASDSAARRPYRLASTLAYFAIRILLRLTFPKHSQKIF